MALFNNNGYKTIMQGIWKSEIDWNEQPPLHIIDPWRQMETGTHRVETFRIPRWINDCVGQEIQLHRLCNACENSFPAVVYVRIISPCNEIKTNILTAKTKVAPLKLKLTT